MFTVVQLYQISDNPVVMTFQISDKSFSLQKSIYARVKGQAPLLAKHIRKSYPNGVRDFFQLCRRSAVKGHPLCHAGAPRRPATAIYKALQAICPATLYRPTGEPAPPAMGMF